jgi:tetratricopeptide (TPR) repeat protein
MNIELYHSLLKESKFAEALRLCDDALNLKPKNANTWHCKGFVHRLLGQYDLAIAAQERSLELEPDEISVIMALGIARQLQGDFRGALDEFRKVRTINPLYAGAYNSAALTFEKMGDTHRAAELYKIAMHALVSSVVLNMKNERTQPYVPVEVCVGSEWVEFITEPAVSLATKAGCKSVSMPTPNMADSEEIAHEYGGMYWFDDVNREEVQYRMYLPNFFHTACLELRQGGEYARYAENLSNILRRMDNISEADKWLAESHAFTY